jgi:hypothetical protein
MVQLDHGLESALAEMRNQEKEPFALVKRWATTRLLPAETLPGTSQLERRSDRSCASALTIGCCRICSSANRR